jgi:putative ABC transport system permease protein
MSGLTQDIWYALRQLRKAPVFALTAVITLALGIGANTAIFTVFNQVLLRMLPVEKPQELVQVTFRGSDTGHLLVFGGDAHMYFSNPMYRDLASRNTVFTGVLADTEASAGVVWKDQGEVADTEIVSGNYFQVLGVPAAMGRTLLPSDDLVKNGSPVVVLSYDYWKTRFAASPDVIDKTLLVNGQPFTIVGVAAPNFSSVINGFKPRIFAPISMESAVSPGRDDLAQRRTRWLNIVARLKPGITAATAEAQMTVLWKQLRADELTSIEHPTPNFGDHFVTQSSIVLLDNSKGFSPLRDAVKTPLLILMGMVILLAIMTCTNLTNLLLVRGAARGKEFAVRYAMGATRIQILRQLLVEGLLLGAIGGLLGLAVAPAAAGVLVRQIAGATGTQPLATRPDAWVLGFTLLLSLAISVLFSLAPALQMMKPDMTDGLRQKSGTNVGAVQSLRMTAVGLQIGLSVLLLAGAGLFIRTLHQLRMQSTGMATDHLAEFSLDPSMSGYHDANLLSAHDRVREALARLPGVTTVSATTDPVLSGNEWDTSVAVEGYTPPPETGASTEIAMVTPEYFTTLRIPLLAGKLFTEGDHDGSAKVAIVNNKFAVQFFGSADKAMGHYIGTGDNRKPDTLIIGVVSDTKHRGLREAMIPILYEPYAQNAKHWNSLEYYVRTTQSPEQAESMVRSAVHQIDPKLVPDGILTMDEQIDAVISNERMIAMLAACFAMVALLITAVGLYGVLAYATEQRTHEIGIRMALGAQRAAVVRLVVSNMAKVAVVAVLVALPVSMAVSRLLQSQLFEVSPFDPLTLCVCAIVTIGMVAIAAAVPARRAASVEPMQALRTE